MRDGGEVQEVQTIRMTRVAANEKVAEVFNGVKDWKGACVSDLVYEIVKKLGFR